MDATKLMSNWFALKEAGREPEWANVANLRSSNIEEYGLKGALNRERNGSEHRMSSGMTSELVKVGKSRKERNTIRKAHYQRKGELEGRKEATRRAIWDRRHGKNESEWVRREAARQTRRAANRQFRKAVRAKKDSK